MDDEIKPFRLIGPFIIYLLG